MNRDERIHEQAVRRRATRRGLRLVKSRHLGLLGPVEPRYTITDLASGRIVTAGVTLDGVEELLAERPTGRP